MRAASTAAFAAGFGLLLAVTRGTWPEPPSPLAVRPFAEWREAGVAVRRLTLPDGTRLEVPQWTGAVMAFSVSGQEAVSPDGRTLVSLVVNESTGIADTTLYGHPTRLDVTFWYMRDAWPSLRSSTRADAAQRPGAPAGTDPLWNTESAAVTWHREGLRDGGPWAVGCWRTPSQNPLPNAPMLARGPHECALASQSAILGAALVRFAAPELDGSDPRLNPARVERIIALVADIERSFVPAPAPARPGLLAWWPLLLLVPFVLLIFIAVPLAAAQGAWQRRVRGRAAPTAPCGRCGQPLGAGATNAANAVWSAQAQDFAAAHPGAMRLPPRRLWAICDHCGQEHDWDAKHGFTPLPQPP